MAKIKASMWVRRRKQLRRGCAGWLLGGEERENMVSNPKEPLLVILHLDSPRQEWLVCKCCAPCATNCNWMCGPFPAGAWKNTGA